MAMMTVVMLVWFGFRGMWLVVIVQVLRFPDVPSFLRGVWFSGIYVQPQVQGGGRLAIRMGCWFLTRV